MIANTQFSWQAEYVIGHDEMDETHHEFVECVNELLCADDGALVEALDAFEAHARRHFADENRSMALTAYESAGCHVDEHAAVLKSLQDVRVALEQGRCDVVRSFARALADWFPEHAQVMDQGLARWLVQKRLGGSPVVVQPRRVAA